MSKKPCARLLALLLTFLFSGASSSVFAQQATGTVGTSVQSTTVQSGASVPNQATSTTTPPTAVGATTVVPSQPPVATAPASTTTTSTVIAGSPSPANTPMATQAGVSAPNQTTTSVGSTQTPTANGQQLTTSTTATTTTAPTGATGTTPVSPPDASPPPGSDSSDPGVVPLPATPGDMTATPVQTPAPAFTAPPVYTVPAPGIQYNLGISPPAQEIDETQGSPDFTRMLNHVPTTSYSHEIPGGGNNELFSSSQVKTFPVRENSKLR